MPIELAKIQLNRVHKVETLEQASLVYHRVPGLEGSIAQDLGRDSVRLYIEGIFYGAKASENLETLRKAYKQRQPVDFLADVVGQAYFSQVVLERFEVVQSAQIPEQFSYRLTIAEYIPPTTSAAANQAAVNQVIAKQAQALMDVAMLPDAIALGSIPELTNPVEPLTGAMEEIKAAFDGLSDLKTIFESLSTLTLEPSASSAPTIQQLQPKLEWSAVTVSTDELLKAGISVKSLLDRDIAIEELLKAGATTHALLAAGVSEDDLAKAGISEADLAIAKKVQETLVTEVLPLLIAIAFSDAKGLPLANQRYEITLPHGAVQTGTLDLQGQAQIEVISLGNCTITFPDLEAEEWKSEEIGSITLQIEDVDGNPLSGEVYQLIDPDGTIRPRATLDEGGQAQIDNLIQGQYGITLPSRESEIWMLQIVDHLDEIEDEAIDENSATENDGERWIIVKLIDQMGNPIRNEPYNLTMPDGTSRRGRLNEQGQIRLDSISAGSYTLSFPDRPTEDWEFLQSE